MVEPSQHQQRWDSRRHSSDGASFYCCNGSVSVGAIVMDMFRWELDAHCPRRGAGEYPQAAGYLREMLVSDSPPQRQNVQPLKFHKISKMDLTRAYEFGISPRAVRPGW